MINGGNLGPIFLLPIFISSITNLFENHLVKTLQINCNF